MAARSLMAKLERAALALAVGGGVLALLTATGCSPTDAGKPSWAWAVHPLLFLLGVGGGFAARLRSSEIDRRRWRIVEDSQLTSGERQHAHKEAERQRRWAGTIFLLGPTFFALWLAYQLRGVGGGPGLLTDLLLLTPLPGFLLGLVLAARGEAHD